MSAPPVADGDFSYAYGLFTAQTGKTKHPRASPAELAAHFASGRETDHPAHWFEAQLVHYGLKPSKTKAVARMRLFDAHKAGGLVVPVHLARLEEKLKKEWTKQDKAASTAASAGAGTGAGKKPAAAAGTKRKAEVVVNVVVNNAASASVSASAPQPAVKKFKTKQTARRGTGWKPALSRQDVAARSSSPILALSEAADETPKPRPKQYARRGAGWKPGLSRQDVAARSPSPPPPPKPRYFARCSRGASSSSRGNLSQRAQPGSSPPPPYSPPSSTSTSLGLINGSYDLDCPYVDEQWDKYEDEEFELVLRLAGTKVWGRFDLGVVSGIMCFDKRPYKASQEKVPFTWRGREDEGPIMYGHNGGWMKFFGDGQIEGYLDYMGLSFEGGRDEEYGMQGDVSARDFQNEWAGYNEEAYEEENRSRW